jgi:hypothetical protein
VGDFIDISTATSLAMVSLYHAKHGRRALSASGFHESVGQAIKNLGRMTLPSEFYASEIRFMGEGLSGTKGSDYHSSDRSGR